jgi:hypothetical protein
VFARQALYQMGKFLHKFVCSLYRSLCLSSKSLFFSLLTLSWNSENQMSPLLIGFLLGFCQQWALVREGKTEIAGVGGGSRNFCTGCFCHCYHGNSPLTQGALVDFGFPFLFPYREQ